MSPGQRYYTALLRLLPEDYRARREQELLEAFEGMRAELGEAPGLQRLLRFYLGLTADLLRRVRPERARVRRRGWEGPLDSPDTSRRYQGRGPIRHLDALRTDLRVAVRSLAKRPLFLAVATLSLTIGVGANAAVFSVVDATLLRSRAGIGHPSKLVELVREGRGLGTFSYLDFQDIRTQVTPFSHVSAMHLQPLSLSQGGEGVRVLSFMVSADYFRTLEVGDPMGRYFLPEEDMGPDQHFVVVLSHRLWQERFGGDANILGRAVELNRHTFTVVGVAPAEFRGHLVAYEPDLYLPLMQHPVLNRGINRFESRGGGWLSLYARLGEGASREEAQAALNTLHSRLAQEFPESHASLRFQVRDFGAVPAAFRAPATGFLGAVSGLVFLVFLITCSNLAGVSLARALEREREMAIRLSLGSGRLSLIRPLLAEVVMVFLLGGILGLAAASWLLSLVPLMDFRAPIPIHLDLMPDARILSFGLGVTLLTGIAFGLLPSLLGTRVGISAVLKGESRGGTRGAGWLRRALVSAQIGLSLVLVLSAGLFLRSLQRAQEIETGFDPGGVYLTHLDLSMEGYTEDEGRGLQRRILESLPLQSWVEAVAISADLPMDMGQHRTVFHSEEWRSWDDDGTTGAHFDVVSPDYFSTLRIPVMAGRSFQESDGEDAEGVTMVSETLARQFWPGQNPLGKIFHLYDAEGPAVRVVGVVGDVKPALITDEPAPIVYLPLAQMHQSSFYVSVRTAAGPGSTMAMAELRRQLLSLDPKLSLQSVTDLTSYTGAGILPQRAAAWITAPLAVLALILSGIGIYGVVAQTVVLRRKEIGVRRTLGAGMGSVVRLVLEGVSRMALPGLVLGALGATALCKVLRSFLLGLGPWDPMAFGSVVLAMAAVMLLASIVPTWKALGVDPVETLKEE